MSKDFIVLNGGTCFGQVLKNDEEYKAIFDFIDIYDLPHVDLSNYKCMVINCFVDQEFLYKHRQLIKAFLDSGKVLIFSGNLFLDWLPGGSTFIPKEVQSVNDYKVYIQQESAIFNGVLEEDMTFKKGVAGFFARGHHPAPEGAEVLLTLGDGEPINYIDRNSTNGTIFVHVGNDVFPSSMSEEKNKTTDRIGPQLIQWVHDEYERIQLRGVRT